MKEQNSKKQMMIDVAFTFSDCVEGLSSLRCKWFIYFKRFLIIDLRKRLYIDSSLVIFLKCWMSCIYTWKGYLRTCSSFYVIVLVFQNITVLNKSTLSTTYPVFNFLIFYTKLFLTKTYTKVFVLFRIYQFNILTDFASSSSGFFQWTFR